MAVGSDQGVLTLALEAIVARQPDAPALDDGTACLTYAALGRRVDALAGRIAARLTVREAVVACLAKIYSKPERVIAWARALRNSSGAVLAGRTFSHAFTAAAVSFQRGMEHSP